MKSSTRFRQLAGDMLIFTIGTVLAKAIQFLLMPLYTGCMTAEAYGTAELTNNLSELLFPAVTLCIYEAAFRYAVDPDTDNGKIVRSVVKVMGISMLLGLVAAVVADRVFRYEYAYYLYFILYAYSFRMCAAYYVRGKGLSKEFAISGIVNAFALAILSVIFLVKLNCGIRGYLLAIAMSYLVSGLYLFAGGHIYKDIRSADFDRETNDVLLQYGVPLIFYNILYWFTTISGRYVLLWFSDARTAGLYVSAIKIAAVINMMQQAIYAAFQLNTSRVYEEDASKEAYYTSIINLFISMYCAFGALMICLSKLIAVFALRGEFYETKVYLPLIMFSALLSCISSLLGTMYSTYKKTRRKIGVSLTGAAVNLAAGIVLAPKLGIWGICIASVLCYLSQTAYMVIDVNSFCHITYKRKNIAVDALLLSGVVAAMTYDLDRGLMAAVILTAILFVRHAKDFVEMIKALTGSRGKRND